MEKKKALSNDYSPCKFSDISSVEDEISTAFNNKPSELECGTSYAAVIGPKAKKSVANKDKLNKLDEILTIQGTEITVKTEEILESVEKKKVSLQNL